MIERCHTAAASKNLYTTLYPNTRFVKRDIAVLSITHPLVYTLQALPTQHPHTKGGNLVTPNYYTTRKAKLLKTFDKAARYMRKAAAARHGDKFAGDVVTGARREFETLIPSIPYIGGKKNRLTNSALVPSVACLALYRTLIARGKTTQDAGDIIDATVRSQFESFPALALHLVGWYRSTSHYLKGLKKQAALSQERKFSGDWVFTIIDGDGEDFDYGIDFSECGICKYFGVHDAEELIPYMCATDFIASDALGSGLTRTTTLAEGADKCNFRFKRGRAAQ